jgi:predicted ATPase
MIKEISIKNFKSIKDVHLSFGQINLMVGLNGAGKTNLIRAITLIRNLAMGSPLEESTKEMMVVPSELFFQQDMSTEISLSIDVAKEGIGYSFELIIENDNNRQINILPLKIKSERLLEYLETNENVKKIVYKRESGNLVKNEDGQNIPIEVASNQTVSGIYKHPSIVAFRELIRGVNFINADIVNSSKQSRFARYDDPTNLTSLIVKLKHEDEKKFKMFEDTLKKLLPSLSNITDFSAGESTGNDKGLFLVLFEQLKLAGKLSFKSLSDGDVRTLMIILSVVLLEENSTLILEEVENALHPHRVKLIIEYLKRVSYSNDLQLILTTHNPLIIDTIAPEEVIYVQRQNGSGSQFIQFKDSKYTSKIHQVLKEGGNLTDFMESMLT